MSQQKILVTGARGAQGGSVARHLLARGVFAVRALTRDPGSAGATSLAAAGAEVVRGDFDDLDSLHAALDGCYGVFGVTSVREPSGRQYEHGRNLVDAVEASGVGHFVFSTLPHVKKRTGGELEVPRFDLKAGLEDYTRGLGLPVTFVHAALCAEELLGFAPLRKGEDGRYVFGFPRGDANLSVAAADDLGGVVAAVFERPAGFIGRTVPVLGDDLPPQRYAEIMTRLCGKPVSCIHISREDFASLGFPGAREAADMFDFYRRYPPYTAEDLARCRALYPAMQTFERWLTANRDRFLSTLD